MTEETPAPVLLEPVRATERIEILDVLRGLAVFGIFLINFPLFVGPSAAFFGWESRILWAQPTERAALLFLHIFAQGKFYTLFATLFGLGFGIQLVRATTRNTPDFPAVYRRRLLWLLVIGVVHATLFWWGDVLHTYALLGFFLLAFRNIPDRVLLRIIIALLLVPAAGTITANTIQHFTRGPGDPPNRAQQLERAKIETEIYSSGRLDEILKLRLRRNLRQLGVEAGWSVELLTAFLIGLWAARRRIFDDPSQHKPLLIKLAAIALPAGLLITVVDLIYAYLYGQTPAPLWRANLSFLREFLARPAMAYGYAAVLLLIGYQAWMRPLAAAGRMALTNYLLHTLVFTTIANSYGFGLYGKITPYQGIPICLAFFAVQIFASQWWLRRHAFGPVEWWWRYKTYGVKPRWLAAEPISEFRQN